MNADSAIRNKGMNALIERLGMIDAERFVMLMRRDSFDYTKWREDLFDGLSLEELSQKAKEYRQSLRTEQA